MSDPKWEFSAMAAVALVALVVGMFAGHCEATKPTTFDLRQKACLTRNSAEECRCWMLGQCPEHTDFGGEESHDHE